MIGQQELTDQQQIDIARLGLKQAEARLKEWLKVLKALLKNPQSSALEIETAKNNIMNENNNIADFITTIKVYGGKYLPSLNIELLTQSTKQLLAAEKSEVIEETKNIFKKFSLPLWLLGGFLLYRFLK